MLCPGFVGTSVPPWLGELLGEGLAGVWLFGHNIDAAQQASALCAQVHAVSARALVASDEEGGTVTRLHHRLGSPWPSAMALGRVDDPDLTRAVAAELGTELSGIGIDLGAAPFADVNSDPDNPVIGVRSFGADTALVARHVAAFTAGLREAGLLACLKHFPGHGATQQDSHLTLPVVDAAPGVLETRDLPPFRAGIEAGAEVVMTAHLLVTGWGGLPATLNPRLLSMLRTGLGFTGVVCSDALDMHAIAHSVGRAEGLVAAVAAGVDLVCVGNPAFPEGYDAQTDTEGLVGALVTAVRSGRLSRQRLADAADRVRQLGERQARVRAKRPERHRFSSALEASAGDRAARAALQVEGRATVIDPALDPVFVLASGAMNIASGARQEVMRQVIAERLGGHVPVVALGAAPEQGCVVAVTDDRTDLASPAVRHLLARTAGVVHMGFRPVSVRSDQLLVRTFGGGRASCTAALDALTVAELTSES